MTKRTLFFFLFSIYLLAYSPAFHSSDGQAMFATAESLARRGAWDIEQLRWMGLQQGTFGLDGLLYSRKGAGQPLLALPLTVLGLMVPFFGTATATLLFGSLLTALTAVLLAAYLQALGFGDRTALLAGLIFGTGTMALPYAKTFFSDPLAGTLLLATAFSLLKLRQTGRWHFALAAGLALGWAVATRYAEAVFLAVFGLEVLVSSFRFQVSGFKSQVSGFKSQVSGLKSRFHVSRITFHGSPAHFLTRTILAFSAPIAAIGFSLLAFNVARYGDPLSTGYLPQETFSAIWWQGIAGQLVSPGRGFLWYNPILWVSFFGIRYFWRHHRTELWGITAVILIHLLLYGKWFMWHGGFSWGARFMVPTLPFWVILLAPVLENMSRRTKWVIGGLWMVSLLVQIPGVAVDFDLWQNRLLETGLPLFAPQTFFDPQFSPLLKTWQFITVPNLDVAWVVGGAIQWGLLAVLLVNLALAGAAMARKEFRLRRASAGMAVFAALFLLFSAHRAQPADLRAAFAQINALPDAPLIYQNPAQATVVAELDKGRAPVLGLGQFEAEAISRVTAQAAAVWWLPTYQNETEAFLLDNFGVARTETFGEQRLLLFAHADGERQTVGARFGDGVVLETAQVSRKLSSNRPLGVTLVWRAETAPTRNYRVFIHLRNAAGETVAQSDGEPVHWTRPTSSWQAGETITDRHALWVGDLPPGAYSLVAGLYLPETGERLRTADDSDVVEIGNWRK